MSHIYYQRQIGDLCRLCSLNSFLGYEKFSAKDFFDYCDEYDSIIKGLKSRNMDGFAEGRSIVSYILDKEFNKFSVLIPINNYKKSRDHIDLDYYKFLIKKDGIKCYFEFNKNHIWLNKKIKNKWYKIDSISGVNHTEPILNNNGFIIVIENKILYIEIENYITELKKYFKNKKIEDGNDIPEILLFNLFFSLKQIQINKYIEKFKPLFRLYENLTIFVKYSRNRTTINNTKIKIGVCNSIKNILLEIVLY